MMDTKGRPIFSTICGIFAGSSFDINIEKIERWERRRPGDVLLGRVGNLKAKLFRALAEEVSRSCGMIDRGHDAEHDRGTATDESCRSYARRYLRFKEAESVLISIFWEYVYKEFPMIAPALDDVILRTGWEIVCAEGAASDRPGLYAPGEIGFDFLGQVASACRGGSSLNPPLQLPEVAKSGEEVIGEVKDNILRQIRLLSQAFTIEELSVNSRKADRGISARMFQYTVRSQMLQDLFWLGVAEIVPGVEAHGEIGLRRGWKIVSIAEGQGDAEADNPLSRLEGQPIFN